MENLSPHSAMARAKVVRVSQKTGREIKPPAPTEHEVAILRRIARGALLMTMIDGEPAATYDDGAAIATFKGERFNDRMLKRFLKNGWLIPVKGESLLGGQDETPQRYICP
jgi:hypothetical protein